MYTCVLSQVAGFMILHPSSSPWPAIAAATLASPRADPWHVDNSSPFLDELTTKLAVFFQSPN